MKLTDGLNENLISIVLGVCIPLALDLIKEDEE